MMRRCASGIAVILMMLTLAACGGGSQPFGKPDTTAGPAGKTVPPIAVRSLAGLPSQAAADLKAALAASGGQRDIAFVEGQIGGGELVIDGQFEAIVQPGGISISYRWTLFDGAGTQIHAFAGTEQAPPATSANAWSAVTFDVWRRIADATSLDLARRLSQLGYATRLSSIVAPPWETFVAAGPGAENDIDYETLNGPGAADPVAAAFDGTAGMEPPSRADSGEDAAGSYQEAATQQPPAPKKNAGKATRITAVAVLPVTGAGGEGNRELTGAMRETLKTAGWKVAGGPRADALTLTGKVTLSKPVSGTQKVSLVWVIATPDGKVLGDIKQSNAVPAGSLDKSWGEGATYVAEAAATGIFELIGKYR
jgi:hypothetical protein